MKIIVAGAGHGGLTAAAKLAAAGHDVSVYEKNEREFLGHDWEDRFTFDTVLSAVGAASFADGTWRYRGDCAFVSPDYNTRVVIKYDDSNRQKIMWRKPLISLLVDYAEKCGAKFIFGEKILGTVISGGHVVGIKTESGEHRADLVIDSAGVFSPVRQSLPDSFNIEKMPERGDVFLCLSCVF